ncbi:MAG TPA: hypothetical protein PLM56_05740 [Cyclobacteriaceae bacterium]|nr:hypothetical protein [Cyclobacteriaceae bacterium]HRF32977.1 hypothetical protein [Cyclobacteriaceae bacterium]
MESRVPRLSDPDFAGVLCTNAAAFVHLAARAKAAGEKALKTLFVFAVWVIIAVTG